MSKKYKFILFGARLYELFSRISGKFSIRCNPNTNLYIVFTIVRCSGELAAHVLYGVGGADDEASERAGSALLPPLLVPRYRAGSDDMLVQRMGGGLISFKILN